MGLLPLDEFQDLLACPVCRSVLQRTGGHFRCAAGHAFDRAGGIPVLVDFDRSILDRGDVVNLAGASTIRRGNRDWKGALIGALLPRNDIAARNAERLVAVMPKRGKVLVVGGADAGAGTEILYDRLDVIGFDIYGSELVQVIADAHTIPLAAESVDAVWIQAVLEHVLDPWTVVEEIHRVLKPEGLVYAETPFLQPVHEGPYDFTRFTASGHRWLFRRFSEIDAGIAMGVASSAVSGIELFVRGLFRSVKAGIIAKALLFWMVKLERMIRPDFSQDGASAVFFFGRKSPEELEPRAMVGYYSGGFRRD